MAQFAPLLGCLVNVAPCVGIDMPGCARSEFQPRDWNAYTTEALVALYKVMIEKYLKVDGAREVVLVGHSMGCSLSALLASESRDYDASGPRLVVRGLVAICPKASPPTQNETAKYRTLLCLPDLVLDFLRWLDKRGGTESASVTRFVGKNAEIDLKELQLRFNTQSKTPVWKRMALGSLPVYDQSGVPHGGFPGREVWASLDMPLLLAAGEGDKVTKAEEATKIVSYLQKSATTPTSSEEEGVSEPIPETDRLEMDNDITQQPAASSDSKFGLEPSTNEVRSRNAAVVKTATLPYPASHALLYDHATYRTLAGLIEDFLSKHVNERLSLGWQLQHLNSAGKWDVKNLEKWKTVVPVSDPIGGGALFRAMKTLREQDEVHTPSAFVQNWSGKIYVVIDISHDSPTYDPKLLNQGGIQYHKFPTVSKIPPTATEVQDFVALVERLSKEMREKFGEGSEDQSFPAIGVHCHYGYNRTGFFIVCYLIQKRGYRVQDAIDEFERKRPPGIRHAHFLDTLFVRYCVGLKKAPTMKLET